MANEEHLRILTQDVEAWNQWRADNPGILPDLQGADLSLADLTGADLSEADLRSAYLNGAKLTTADLRRANLRISDLSEADLSDANLAQANLVEADLWLADLRRANLSEARLEEARLSQANLGEANLRRTELYGVDFCGAHLDKADMTGAAVAWTIFGDIDLSEVKGLENVEHHSHSTIGIDTIYRSKGNIPESFLRGVGVPEDFITYVASLVGKPIQFYSCFISYSSKDQETADRLHTDLQSKGIRCWFAPEDMKIGDRIRPRIDQTIRLHDKLLLILSQHSIKSDWVEAEVETALEEERRRGQTVLFPIRLDNSVMETEQAWAAHIRRTRHIGDFSNWKDHDAYQEAFARLLRDLEVEGEETE